MRVYLVRHPQPLVAAGVCYGGSDLSCAPAQQVRTLAAVLPQLPRTLSGIPVFSSPMLRCAALARRLPDATPIFDARLREMEFGAWEMQRWDEIARAEIDAWAADLLDYRPGGGESVRRMAQRVHAFYLELRQRDEPQAIVVCHAGSMRMLAACAPQRTLEHIALEAASSLYKPAYGEVLPLEIMPA
jgi:alpha-ribazole phosphatase